MKGVLTMTIKEKLEAIQAINDKNYATDKAFAEAEKNRKAWKVSFAVVTADNRVEEDEFVGKAVDIAEMFTLAKEVLEYAAPLQGWVKWMIWDIGIMGDELLF